MPPRSPPAGTVVRPPPGPSHPGLSLIHICSANPTYARILNLINSGDLGTAERLLNEVPQKNGEWYFLSGSIAYRKGWLDEAMQNYSLACQMDPGNMEYRQALAMMQQGGQAYRPYGYLSLIHIFSLPRTE